MRLLRGVFLNRIYRFRARMGCGFRKGGGRSRLLPFRLLSRRSGCVPALPYPPLRYFQSESHQPRRAMIGSPHSDCLHLLSGPHCCSPRLQFKRENANAYITATVSAFSSGFLRGITRTVTMTDGAIGIPIDPAFTIGGAIGIPTTK